MKEAYMFYVVALVLGEKTLELAIKIHNDFMTKWRKAQAEGRV